MEKDLYFMSLALEEAKIALLNDEVPVGCVLVLNDEVIARGHNSREKDFLITCHAEINALQEANKKMKNFRLENCVLYVTLEPCQMCVGAIQQARIRRIVYGAKDEKNGALGGLYDFFLIPKMNHYPFITSNILEEECSNILKEYFKKKRAK